MRLSLNKNQLKQKIMKKAIFLLAALCITLSSWAYDFTSGGFYYNITSSTSPYTVAVTYATTSYNSYAGNITIPSSVTYNSKTYSISSIGSNAFSECSGLTSISIPSSVTTIGGFAFMDCTSLTTLTIPNSVTSIESYALDGCDGLTSITLSSSLTTLKEAVIYYCANLTTINIPASVTSINYLNFDNCPKLTSITVDNGNTSYSSNGVVLFNKNKTTLVRYPTGLTGSYTVPSTVTTIGSNSFIDCDGLTSVTLPSSVVCIGDSAFECENLTSINIPSSVTYIGIYSFSNCSSLTSITIPASVTTIGYGAFVMCTGLTSIYVKATTPLALSDASDIFWAITPITSTCTLHVPVGTKSLYQAATVWKDFTSIVADVTPVFNAKASNLKITTENGKAVISGLSQGTPLAVYNLQGTAIYNQQATSETVSINLPARGVYVVKVGNESVKVVY